MRTTHHTVLITGGTSGIGLALAKRFLKAGNTVIVTSSNVQKAKAVQRDCPDLCHYQHLIRVRARPKAQRPRLLRQQSCAA